MEPTHAIRARPTREAAVQLLESAGLPSQDLTDAHLDHFFCVGPSSTPYGLIGLELHASDALLRSLVVAPDRRRTGLATALVAHAERHALSQGATSIFLLTTTAEAFFQRRGYVVADRASAPRAIRATREFTDLCPASSAFLMKTLVG
jgi:N-acetylglutamate synthase-like GNAT family acetyltransferase